MAGTATTWLAHVTGATRAKFPAEKTNNNNNNNNNNNRNFSGTTAMNRQTTECSGFRNKQYFLVSITESASCFLSVSEQCCYRTFDWMNTDLAKLPAKERLPELV